MAKKVLVVEDNELNLRLFCDLLRAHDCAVEGVRDGRDALAAAHAMLPDLIVMDIQMPHVTGLELIEAIRADAELAHIPVMAVTAYAGKADEDRIRAAGADAYVSKPIALMRFVEVVEGLLTERVGTYSSPLGGGGAPEGRDGVGLTSSAKAPWRSHVVGRP